MGAIMVRKGVCSVGQDTGSRVELVLVAASHGIGARFRLRLSGRLVDRVSTAVG
jgi:hypothetical protein